MHSTHVPWSPRTLQLAAFAILSTALPTPFARAQSGFLVLSDVAPSGFQVLSVEALSVDGTFAVGIATGPLGRVGYKWSAHEGLVILSDPTASGPDHAEAFGVSADGDTVAGVGREEGFVGPGDPLNGFRGVIWRTGSQPQLLPKLAAPYNDSTIVRGVSADGTVVIGTGYNVGPNTSGFPLQAARWINGVLTPLPATPAPLNQRSATGVSASGDVIAITSGRSELGQYWWPYLIVNGGVVALSVPSPSTNAYTRKVASNGAYVAGFQFTDASFAQSRALRWTVNGSVTIIPQLPGLTNLDAFDVADSGSPVIGTTRNATGPQTGWIWTEAAGTQLVSDYVTSVTGVPTIGRTFTNVRSTSSDGSVLGGGSVHTQTGQSQAWLLFVDNAPVPTVVTQPEDVTVSNGTDVMLSVQITSPIGCGGVTYQWRRNEVPIDPMVNATATTAVLTIPAVQSGDAGSYSCVVSNACGSATSNAATLTICAADFDGSGFVDSDDFILYAEHFALGCTDAGVPEPSCTRSADFDASGFVDSDDFVAFVSAFSASC
jgi:hypothetical protein